MSTGVTTSALTDSDLTEMTLEKVAAAFARGVTSEALTKAFLERIATYNPH
jgi:aspartyl-tRNA(Asn)/glutamyl-tRNA(Gln) amidotransferase subunit A